MECSVVFGLIASAFVVARDRSGRRCEERVEAFFHDRVAFARRLLQAGTIQHLNRSAAIADQARGLHRLRGQRLRWSSSTTRIVGKPCIARAPRVGFRASEGMVPAECIKVNMGFRADSAPANGPVVGAARERPFRTASTLHGGLGWPSARGVNQP
jgi:hypothetical protein